MGEASTIAKAITQAWERAENPLEFTVKILEKPTSRFFGFITKPAKIALFFSDVKARKEYASTKKTGYQRKRDAGSIRRPTDKRYATSQSSRRSQHSEEGRESKKSEYPESLWTEEMLQIAQIWLKTVFSIYGKTTPPKFSFKIKGNLLAISYNRSVTNDKSQEEPLLFSLAHLLMRRLRSRFKNHMVNLKIVIENETS